MVLAARFKTTVQGQASSWADLILAEMRRHGKEPMPWQVEAAELIGALDSNGYPLFKRVVLTVPRQSGKTALIKCVLAAQAQRRNFEKLYITAQTRHDATKHLEDLGNHLLMLGDQVNMRLANGSERIQWSNGSTLEVVPPTPTGGHGLTIGLMVLDEVWALEPHVMAGIVPATVANPFSQLIFISTMGTVESEVWNELCRQGRENVDNVDASIAYLEYSAENDADIFDEGKWHEFMPALGHTQSFDSVRATVSALPAGEAVRAMANRVTAVVSSVFPDEWVEEAWATIQPAGKYVVAVDVNDSPPGATVTTAHVTEDNSVALRQVFWRYGSPRWVLDSLATLLDRREVEAVVGDFGGPAKQLAAELEELCRVKRVTLVKTAGSDVTTSSLAFFDALRERKVLLHKTVELDTAIKHAKKRSIGDVWLISRNLMTVDASPIISAILAFGVQKQLMVKPRARPQIFA